MAQSFAFLAVLIVMISYARIGSEGVRQFDWANAITFMPIAFAAYSLEAYPSMMVSLFFGLIAIRRLRG